MAIYPKAIQRLIPLDKKMDPPIKARVVILHVAATEATSLAPYFTSGSGGVESHFYVRYDGSVEQYRDTAYQADANVMANDFAISIESQGLADGTWTAAQLDTIKALLTWCHETHGIPLVVCPKWDGSGVGYHILFEDQWDQRHASCPGPNRIKQFTSVLVPWMAQGSEDDVTPDEITQAVIAALKTDGLVSAPIGSNPTVAPVTALRYAMEWSLAARNAAQVAANAPGVTAQQIADAIPDDLAKQVVDALAVRLKEN